MQVRDAINTNARGTDKKNQYSTTKPSTDNITVDPNRALAQRQYEQNIHDKITNTGAYAPSSVATYQEQVNDYSAILDELRALANQKYSALQEALMKNKQRQDDDARRRYALNERRWKRTYGNGTNGQGLSSLFDIRNAQNHDLADSERDYSTNMANLLANKYDDNFNIAKLLMQYK